MGRKGRERIYQVEVIDFQKRNNGQFSPRRTLFMCGKSVEKVRRWGARFGTVLHCRKVDTSYYYHKSIDNLVLDQKPISIEIDSREEYVVSRSLELNRPRKRYSDKKFVDPIDKEEYS